MYFKVDITINQGGYSCHLKTLTRNSSFSLKWSKRQLRESSKIHVFLTLLSFPPDKTHLKYQGVLYKSPSTLHLDIILLVSKVSDILGTTVLSNLAKHMALVCYDLWVGACSKRSLVQHWRHHCGKQ